MEKKLYEVWLHEYLEGRENFFTTLLTQEEYRNLIVHLDELKAKQTLADHAVVEASQFTYDELNTEIKDWLEVE